LELLDLRVTGDANADDLTFSGTFGVAAITPGSDEPPLTIFDAGLDFIWADLGDPFNVRVKAQQTSLTGLVLEKLLNLDLKTVVLGMLLPLDKLGDLILGIEALDTPLPGARSCSSTSSMTSPRRCTSRWISARPCKPWGWTWRPRPRSMWWSTWTWIWCSASTSSGW